VPEAEVAVGEASEAEAAVPEAEVAVGEASEAEAAVSEAEVTVGEASEAEAAQSEPMGAGEIAADELAPQAEAPLGPGEEASEFPKAPVAAIAADTEAVHQETA
jgi:hypothetical protein